MSEPSESPSELEIAKSVLERSAAPSAPPADEPPKGGSKRRRKPPKPRDPPPAERERPPTPLAEAGLVDEAPAPAAPAPAAPPPALPAAASAPPRPNGVRVYTAQDEVPPDESDPLSRDGVTYGEIAPADGMQFPDSAGVAKSPANLTDVCRLYRIGPGDGDCYVRVERKKPPSWQNQQTAGHLGRITRPISESEFKDIVLGGVYELVVYGPDPRGTVNPHTGEREIKALTKPFTATHPGRPRLLRDIEEYMGLDDEPDDRSEGMRPWDPMAERRPGYGRGEATSADAAMHRDALSFANKRLEQSDEELRQLRNRPEVAPAALEAVRDSARVGVEALKETAETTKTMLLDQLREKEKQIDSLRAEMREVRELANAPRRDDEPSLAKAIADIANNALNHREPTGPGKEVYESHSREIERVTSAHSRELESIRARHEEQVRGYRDDIDKARTDARERERDLRDGFEKRERELRDGFDKRERELIERGKEQLESLRAEHRREIEEVKRQQELLRETQKIALEARIASAEERIEMAKEDASRARDEAANKEDFMAQMEEFQQKAEIMGYSKKGDEENAPNTWQERIAQSIGRAIENADTIFAAGQKTFEARAQAIQIAAQATRAAQQPPQRQLPQQQPPPGVQPGARPGAPTPRRKFWATEDGVPYVDQPPPNAAPPPPPQPSMPKPQVQAPPQAQPQAPPAQPPPQPEAPPQAAAPAGNGAPPAVTPQMVSELRVILEQNLAQGVEPAAFAQFLVQQLGPSQLGVVVSSMTADGVLGVLSEDPDGVDSPLLSTHGKWWFRQVWSEGAKLVQQ